MRELKSLDQEIQEDFPLIIKYFNVKFNSDSFASKKSLDEKEKENFLKIVGLLVLALGKLKKNLLINNRVNIDTISNEILTLIIDDSSRALPGLSNTSTL